MSDFKVEGVLKHIGDTVVVSEKFSKREFVLTVPHDQYPQHVAFQLTQAKCDNINSYGVGQNVTVSFNLRGREWTSPQGEVKYFNTLEAWRIESAGSSAPEAAITEVIPGDDEELPF
jgi:hypothetical protein